MTRRRAGCLEAPGFLIRGAAMNRIAEFERDEDPVDPIAVLERMLTSLPPDQLERGIDALRKVTRGYVRTAREANLSLAHVEEAIAQAFERARPALSDSQRRAMLEQLIQTCRVWHR